MAARVFFITISHMGEGHFLEDRVWVDVDSTISVHLPPCHQGVQPRGCRAAAITGFLGRTSTFLCFWKLLLIGNDFATDEPNALAVLQTRSHCAAMCIFSLSQLLNLYLEHENAEHFLSNFLEVEHRESSSCIQH